jgi:peptidoglycan LD-endopeptidase LytH
MALAADAKAIDEKHAGSALNVQRVRPDLSAKSAGLSTLRASRLKTATDRKQYTVQTALAPICVICGQQLVVMKWSQRQRSKTLLIALAILVGLVMLLVRLSRRPGQNVVTLFPAEPSPISLSRSTYATPSSELSPAATPSVNGAGVQSTPAPVVQASGLIIPVAGVRADQLLDTFSTARGDGRVHDAIDIAAAKDTPVLAVANGKILKLFQSKAGGTTIYQLSSDERFIYYYAHLDRYADGLSEGHPLTQGETIAYVGDTGNAGAGNYHLHFSIAMTSDPKRWWEGVNINPYPLLRK